MHSYRKELRFNLPTRQGFVDITPEIEDCLRESGIQDGLALICAMHITASVYINNNKDSLLHDDETWLEQLASCEVTGQYWRNRTGEGNADAHLKRQGMGCEVVVVMTPGKLDFGRREQISCGEFDDRRCKRMRVKVIGG